MKFIWALFLLSACGGPIYAPAPNPRPDIVPEPVVCHGAKLSLSGVCVRSEEQAQDLDPAEVEHIIDIAINQFITAQPAYTADDLYNDIQALELIIVVRPVLRNKDLLLGIYDDHTQVVYLRAHPCIAGTALGHEMLHVFQHIYGLQPIGDIHDDPALFISARGRSWQQAWSSAENQTNIEACGVYCSKTCGWARVSPKECAQDNSCP